MTSNYWSATDDYLIENGGKKPKCSNCGAEMFAEDDHGMFKCFSCNGSPSTNMAKFSRISIKGGKISTIKPGETE